jgi:hypothetical protein
MDDFDIVDDNIRHTSMNLQQIAETIDYIETQRNQHNQDNITDMLSHIDTIMQNTSITNIDISNIDDEPTTRYVHRSRNAPRHMYNSMRTFSMRPRLQTRMTSFDFNNDFDDDFNNNVQNLHTYTTTPQRQNMYTTTRRHNTLLDNIESLISNISDGRRQTISTIRISNSNISSSISSDTNQGVTKEILDAKSSIITITQPNITCAICMEDFKINAKARYLECTHKYCVSCIGKWFEKHNSCPVCKHQF